MTARPLDRTPERRALTFLACGTFERRRGRWRFGAATVGDSVVDRLVSDGKAHIEGDRVVRTSTFEGLKGSA
jgi:hypothetical protein